MTAIAELVETTNTYYCLDCGVCTGSCPIARVFPDFSPRQIIERSLYELEEPSDDTQTPKPRRHPIQTPSG